MSPALPRKVQNHRVNAKTSLPIARITFGHFVYIFQIYGLVELLRISEGKHPGAQAGNP